MTAPAVTHDLTGGFNLRATLVVALFSTAVFLNAVLLFSVEPMFTKMVLPMLGGTPAVWNTCLLFFQAALLVGYLYAHVTSRFLVPKWQGVLHVALLAVSILLLPIAIPDFVGRPTESIAPVTWLVFALVGTLGIPFTLLAAGAPMLQRWFAHTRHASAGNPYFLYVASNLGSFAALIAYPFVIEPQLRLSEQRAIWAQMYGGLILLILVSALAVQWWLRRTDDAPVVAPAVGEPAPVVTLEEPSAAMREATVPADIVVDDVDQPLPTRELIPTLVPTWHWRLRWVLLSFAPSSLLLGVTTYLSTDVASFPFLWVIPLAIYLLTFVIVFARRPILARGFMLFSQLILGLGLMVALCLGSSRQITAQGALHLLAFFATAMVLHRELADSRPRAEYLTEYYLWISLGGMLGGVFNVLLAPVLYQTVLEYPLALIVAFGLRPGRAKSLGSTRSVVLDFVLPALLFAAVAGAFRLPTPPDEWFTYGPHVVLTVAALIAACFYRRPLRLALAAGAIFFGNRFGHAHTEEVVYQGRSFFGVYKVRRIAEYHILQHGTTTHGGQSLRAQRRLEPLTYYHKSGPFGQLFDSLFTKVPSRRVAIVGLGTGTAACYGRPGERWTYYEIDPLIVRIARAPYLFKYMRDCPPEMDIVMGDARLSLAATPDSTFDLIVLDAFSSDAIPVHLITREALAIYLRKLRPGGMVLYHISNRYLDLAPVLADLANEAQLPGAVGETGSDDNDRALLHYGSRWILLARSLDDFAPLAHLDSWRPLAGSGSGRVWTDDYSDVLGVVKW
jgi:SAM-dependent methyltransferase